MSSPEKYRIKRTKGRTKHRWKTGAGINSGRTVKWNKKIRKESTIVGKKEADHIRQYDTPDGANAGGNKKERERMAGVMAAALLNNQTASKLGDYSDTDLRRIMSMLSGHIDECIKMLEVEKQAKHSQ